MSCHRAENSLSSRMEQSLMKTGNSSAKVVFHASSLGFKKKSRKIRKKSLQLNHSLISGSTQATALVTGQMALRLQLEEEDHIKNSLMI